MGTVSIGYIYRTTDVLVSQTEYTLHVLTELYKITQHLY